MTPKEKAIQLVKKFTSATMTLVADYEWVDDIISAKQCALIAVDEILNVKSFLKSMPLQDVKYWQEVKEEIEKL